MALRGFFGAVGRTDVVDDDFGAFAPKRLAIPCPMPELAPVTMATFPFRPCIAFPPERVFVVL